MGKKITISLATVLILLTIGAIPASQAEKGKTLYQQKTTSKLSKKAETFLSDIEKARSLADVIQSYKRANLSKQERVQLEKVLKKPSYSNKLKKLKEKAVASSRLRSRQKAKQKQLAADRKQKQALNKHNHKAIAKLRRLQSGAKNAGKGLRFRPMTASMQRRALRNSPDDENRAEIRSVNPRLIIPGENITITGQNFGTESGNVDLLILEMAIGCTPTTWEPTRIIARVPLNTQRLLGETDVNGRVWIKPHGLNLGPTTEVRLRPDRSRMEPEIRSIEPREIKPGHIIFISGQNFLTRATESRVTFVFRSQGITHHGIIDYWEDATIAVRLKDDVRGLARGTCDILIRNHFMRQAIYPDLTFIPNLETRTIEKRNWRRSRGESAFENFDFMLMNGWKVVYGVTLLDASPGVPLGGPYPECNYTHPPRIDTIYPRSTVVVTVPEEGAGCCVNWVTIQGPVGTRYSNRFVSERAAR